MWNQGELMFINVTWNIVYVFVIANVNLSLFFFILLNKIVTLLQLNKICCQNTQRRNDSSSVSLLFVTGYNESSMVGGYTQSPGGFASPALSQGGEKKGVCILLHMWSKYANTLLNIYQSTLDYTFICKVYQPITFLSKVYHDNLVQRLVTTFVEAQQ